MNDVAAKKKELFKNLKKFAISAAIAAVLFTIFLTVKSYAASVTVDLGSGDTSGQQFGAIEALMLVTLLALAPSLLMVMTSFTRIIIVLSFLRNSLGTQQSPPNQVLIGLALFLTLFVMWPTFTQVNEQAYKPYSEGVITQTQAVERAIVPMKQFMLKQTYSNDLGLFLSISNEKTGRNQQLGSTPEELTELGIEIVVPAFITSELKRAFTMGFLIFIPFLIIDMVVSSTLMAMGMVMLPPSTIALPFKILMFIMVDGWTLVVETLIRGFR